MITNHTLFKNLQSQFAVYTFIAGCPPMNVHMRDAVTWLGNTHNSLTSGAKVISCVTVARELVGYSVSC